MNIRLRLISIAVRNFNNRPNERGTAVRFMLRNVLQLAAEHLGREQAAALALDALQEPRA